MNNATLLVESSHINKINEYVNWMFKKKVPAVVLKSFFNETTGETKMFLALPVRERTFETKKEDLFTPDILDTCDIGFTKDDIKESKTLYSGDIFDFWDIPTLLVKYRYVEEEFHATGKKYFESKKHILFKDYTRTKQEQFDSFALIHSYEEPSQSVKSIYRLLQTKFVTVISITFKAKEGYRYGNNTL